MKKYVKAYITNEEENAWQLIDKYQEREWGQTYFSESASAITVMELPWVEYTESGESYDGTAYANVDLKHHTLNMGIYVDMYDEGEVDWNHSIKYDSLDDMIDALLKPMADGEITEEDLFEKVQSYYY